LRFYAFTCCNTVCAGFLRFTCGAIRFFCSCRAFACAPHLQLHGSTRSAHCGLRLTLPVCDAARYRLRDTRLLLPHAARAFYHAGFAYLTPRLPYTPFRFRIFYIQVLCRLPHAAAVLPLPPAVTARGTATPRCVYLHLPVATARLRPVYAHCAWLYLTPVLRFLPLPGSYNNATVLPYYALTV